MATCRACGARIEFRETANGRLQPVDADGGVHFATCIARPRLDYPEDLCLRCESHETERGPGTAMHHASLRCLACGAFRWLPRPRGVAS